MSDQHVRMAPDGGDEMSRPLADGLEPEHSRRAVAPTRLARGGEIPAEGRVIHNPISGERIVIGVSGAETGGQLLAFDLFLPPGGHVPARHAHPVQEERFTVVTGLMRFRLGRRTLLAAPGETVIVPAGTAHWFGNASPRITHARVEVRPALRMEELFEMTEAMGLAGQRRGAYLSRLTDLARIVLEFQREVAVPRVPAFLVRALLAPLARLGRRRVRGAGSGSAG